MSRQTGLSPAGLAGCMAIFIIVVTHSAVLASGADWNDTAIRWRPWAKALAEAKQSHKPICLVFYANWCGHCGSYSRRFHASDVVEASRRFVMVRVNQDTNPRLSRRFAIDGEYVPRTYFLSPDGTLAPIHADRDDYKYFYDEDDSASLLSGMRAASRPPSP